MTTNRKNAKIRGTSKKASEYSPPQYSEKQYFKTSKLINRIIKILLILILLFEIVVTYYNIENYNFYKLEIYNILFPFTLVYLFLQTRATRFKKDHEKNKSSDNLPFELWKEYYSVISSVILPYSILVLEFSKKNNYMLLFISFSVFIINTIGDLVNNYTRASLFVLLMISLVLVFTLNIITVVKLILAQTIVSTIIIVSIFVSYIIAGIISLKCLNKK